MRQPAEGFKEKRPSPWPHLKDEWPGGMVTLCRCVTMGSERLHGHAIKRDHATRWRRTPSALKRLSLV
jgi:hypothetical protein